MLWCAAVQVGDDQHPFLKLYWHFYHFSQKIFPCRAKKNEKRQNTVSHPVWVVLCQNFGCCQIWFQKLWKTLIIIEVLCKFNSVHLLGVYHHLFCRAPLHFHLWSKIPCSWPVLESNQSLCVTLSWIVQVGFCWYSRKIMYCHSFNHRLEIMKLIA